MNWLFGTASSKQFTDLDIQFRKLAKRTGDITHIVQQHASLINETLWETKTITYKLLNFSTEIKNLKLQNAQFGRAIQDNFGFFSRRFAYLLEIEESLEALTMAINWCEEFVNDFGIALTSLARQTPSLIVPTRRPRKSTDSNYYSPTTRIYAHSIDKKR